MGDRSERLPTRVAASLWWYARLVIGAVLLGSVLVFVSQNANPAVVHFFSWHFELSISLLIFFVLLIGVVVGALVAGWLRLRRGRRHRG